VLPTRTRSIVITPVGIYYFEMLRNFVLLLFVALVSAALEFTESEVSVPVPGDIHLKVFRYLAPYWHKLT